jgi:uncharacterized protein (TIGR02118 family)
VIHQLIFAHPRPGMSEAEFQRYWVEEHAVRYASKIPQVRRYLVDTRIALPGETGEPEWSGLAEIWLANGEEQLASLQTPEFLEGARLDEPKWAAFWRTLVMDTTPYEIMAGPGERRDSGLVKLVVLNKRKEGLPLDTFRTYLLETHAPRATALPGLRRYMQNHMVDGAYGVGEAVLDAAEQFWFDSVDALHAAETTLEQRILDTSYVVSTEARYMHRMLVQEHWVIGPEPRPYPAPASAHDPASA